MNSRHAPPQTLVNNQGYAHWKQVSHQLGAQTAGGVGYPLRPGAAPAALARTTSTLSTRCRSMSSTSNT